MCIGCSIVYIAKCLRLLTVVSAHDIVFHVCVASVASVCRRRLWRYVLWQSGAS